MKQISPVAYLTLINLVILLITGCDVVTPTSGSVGFVTTTEPTELAPSQISTPTVTKTPFPINTLTAIERKKFVWETLSSNSDCNLPCWWGVTPGKTTWVETEQFLRYLGIRIVSIERSDSNAVLHGAGGFDFEGISTKMGVSFEELDGIVNAILIEIDGYYEPEEDFKSQWKNYSPKAIMELYGVPDRVLLSVPGHSSPNPYRGYYLWIFYDRLGFMLRYGGKVINDPILHICPSIEITGDIDSLDLRLQSPGNSLPLDRFDVILEDVKLQTETGKLRTIYSIQDATGLNETDFFEIFSSKNYACFDTPRDMWKTP